nr:AP-1 complex subunit sigma-1 [Tanacetum cinerariifolium]
MSSLEAVLNCDEEAFDFMVAHRTVIRELSGMILTHGPKLCNFVEWRGFKAVYKSLYFCMCINQKDNELEVREIIHHYVEILYRYFGSVCELDLIFNFHKESSKKTVARLVAAQDSFVEVAKEEANFISNIIAQATKDATVRSP